MEEPSTAAISSVMSTAGSPARSASSRVSSAVMILVVLAMGSRSRAFFSHSTAPDSPESSTALRAETASSSPRADTGRHRHSSAAARPMAMPRFPLRFICTSPPGESLCGAGRAYSWGASGPGTSSSGAGAGFSSFWNRAPSLSTSSGSFSRARSMGLT